MQRGIGFWIAVVLLVQAMAAGVLCLDPRRCHGEQTAPEELAFMEIEDVFAAAKHSQEIKDAPASVSIVTDEDIRKYGFRNITDILQNVTSFYITSDRFYEYPGFRGISRFGEHGNLLLQLIDGHTTNENLFGSFFLGNTFGLDVDLIKKVEVVRGPASALFGSSAFLGVVNVIPKTGADIGGLFTKVEMGSYDTYKGGAIYGKKFDNGLDLICAGTYLDSGGQDFYFGAFDRPPLSNGWVDDADAERAWNGFLKATYGELSFTGLTHQRDKNVPTGMYDTIFGDDRFWGSDFRSFAELKWNHAMSGDRELMARVYYDHYSYDGQYPYDYPPVTMNKDEIWGQWIGSELKYFQKVWNTHSLSFGGEVVRYLDANLENFDIEPSRVLLDHDDTMSIYSMYLQDEWQVSRRLSLVGGLRYDYCTTVGEHLSPRTAFIVKPWEATTFKLLYGQAFRAPSMFELYYDDKGETARANPDLDPEILSSYEAVWEQELSPSWKSVVSLFHYEIEDMIAPIEIPGGVVQYQNAGNITSRGVEAGIEGNWLGGLRGGLSYSYQWAVTNETDEWLANSPRHLVKAHVAYPLYRDKLFLSVQCRYMSDRMTRDRELVDQVFITDINLYGRGFYRNLELSLGVFNLFDVDYEDPVSPDLVLQSLEQNGINVWFKASYRF